MLKLPTTTKNGFTPNAECSISPWSQLKCDLSSLKTFGVRYNVVRSVGEVL